MKKVVAHADNSEVASSRQRDKPLIKGFSGWNGCAARSISNKLAAGLHKLGRSHKAWVIMKRLAIISGIVSAVLLIGMAFVYYQQLPEKIASHFNGRGKADGWMSRESFSLTMVAIGLGIPAFVIAMMYAIRFLPANFLNVPNPNYWRDPQNYPKACDFLFTSSLWFGCAFMIWQIFFSLMIVAANQISPPHLDNGRVILLTLPLLGFTFGWIVTLILRFLKTENT